MKMTQSQECPPILYHGSPHGTITALEPRITSGIGKQYGALVFATHHIWMACTMMAATKPWRTGKFGDTPFTLIVCKRDTFIAEDQGGYIYILPAYTFATSPNQNLSDIEWVSSETIIPFDKLYYPSALEAMLAHGIQVYFGTEEVYQQSKASSDRGLSIFQGLESENQRRGINVRQLQLNPNA